LLMVEGKEKLGNRDHAVGGGEGSQILRKDGVEK